MPIVRILLEEFIYKIKKKVFPLSEKALLVDLHVQEAVFICVLLVQVAHVACRFDHLVSYLYVEALFLMQLVHFASNVFHQDHHWELVVHAITTYKTWYM